MSNITNKMSSTTATTPSTEKSPLLRKFNPKNNSRYRSTSIDDSSDGDGGDNKTGSDIISLADMHRTTVSQTFVHLLKGYIGPGMLSLPWAVSQLGLTFGATAVIFMAAWSSYNCWTVVQLKRFIELDVMLPNKMQGPREVEDEDDGENKVEIETTEKHDDELERASAVSSSVATSITYPDVGEWAYGPSFQSYVTTCICVQQLAICTVFMSFIGENLLAVLKYLGMESIWATHTGVITVTLPFAMALSFLPNLKLLAPVMMAGGIFLLASLAVLGGLIIQQLMEHGIQIPTLNLDQAPLALCAILYSYEGICLILPIESAMKEPQHFGSVFLGSMTIVAFLLAIFSCLCVVAFGDVNNGSVTAYLVKQYGDDPEMVLWLMIANTAVSLSVLLTYPLQLFPALELLGPWFTKKFLGGGDTDSINDIADDKDLTGFDILPSLPEHGVAEIEEMVEHMYEDDEEKSAHNISIKNDDHNDELENSFRVQVAAKMEAIMPTMTLPGDSIQLRATLVMLTYMVAVIVPNVQALISLAGALAGSSTALLIPPILELAWIQRHLHPKRKWLIVLLKRVKCIILLVLGFIFFAIGTYASIADIVKIYRGK